MKQLAVTVAFLIPLIVPHPSAAAKAEGYGSEMKRVQQAVAEGDLLRAESVLAGLLAKHGERPDLLAERGRVLLWQKRYNEALESLQRARQLKPGRELDAEIERVESARLIAEADRHIARGELMQAGALLAGGYHKGGDRYETGTRLAAVRNRQGRHREAAQIYQRLMREYAKDAELPLLYAQALSDMGQKETALRAVEPLVRQGDYPRAHVLRGRILYEQGRYLEAREEYEAAKRLGGTPELAAQRKEVEEALNFRHIQTLVAAGGYDLAQPLLKSMSAPGPYSRDARLLFGKVLLAQRRFDAALAEAQTLYGEYPQDPEVAALYAEALEGKGRGAEAERVLYAVPGGAGERLRAEREDLLHHAKGNWARLTGEGYGFSNRSQTESGAGISVSQRISRVTSVASLSEVTRFGRTDPQIALDLYLPHGDDGRLSGALYLSAAPGSSFLPRYSAGAEAGWAFQQVELFGGYDRVGFHEDAADVVSAAVMWYLPIAPVSVAEKVYFALGRGSMLAVTTISWDPSHRFRAFLAGGAGNASERRIASEDLDRHDTWLVSGGAEYRFSPSYSVGGEGTFESRRALYDRYGGMVYVRYWWP